MSRPVQEAWEILSDISDEEFDGKDPDPGFAFYMGALYMLTSVSMRTSDKEQLSGFLEQVSDDIELYKAEHCECGRGKLN